MVRFRLRTLLFGLTVIAVTAAVVSQIGMTDAHFEFVDSELVADETGRLHGQIRWNFKDRNIARKSPWQFVCSVNNLPAKPRTVARLNSLRPGDRCTVRYRDREITWLKKQDPFRRYLGSKLGIASEHVVGYAWFDGWTEVVIDGG